MTMTNWLEIAKTMASAVGLLRQFARDAGADDMLAEIDRLTEIVRVVDLGDVGQLDVDKARKELQALAERLLAPLAKADDRADAIVEKRFPKKEEP